MAEQEMREKVINGLECCLKGLSDICPYKDSDAPGGCKDELMYNALMLLEAQDPCEDAVSKQAVILALEGEYSDWNDDYNIPITHCIKAVQSLPSIQFVPASRVMTLEEVKQHNNQDGCVWFEQPTYNAVAAFVLKDDFMIQVISPYILGEPINHGYWTNGNYGKTWRCWTSCPDQAVREATPWKY